MSIYIITTCVIHPLLSNSVRRQYIFRLGKNKQSHIECCPLSELVQAPPENHTMLKHQCNTNTVLQHVSENSVHNKAPPVQCVQPCLQQGSSCTVYTTLSTRQSQVCTINIPQVTVASAPFPLIGLHFHLYIVCVRNQDGSENTGDSRCSGFISSSHSAVIPCVINPV